MSTFSQLKNYNLHFIKFKTIKAFNQVIKSKTVNK